MLRQFVRLKLAAVALCAVMLGTSTAIARADDSSMAGIGGTLRMMHSNKSVQMVSEVVTITGLPTGKVDATFWLKNTGGPTDVTIGFPGYGYNDSPLLSNFRSQVDGSPVHVTLVRAKPSGPDDEDSDAWFVKRVHFGANQTRVVRDEYSGGGGDDSMANYWFSYYLHTGSSWKSVIQHATVIADISGLHPYTLESIAPKGYVRHGSTVTWTFENLKPTEDNDIRITYYPAFMSVVVNGALLWDASQSQPDWRAHEDWGSAPSLRRGSDVYLSARSAASWLSANLVVVQPNKMVRLVRGNRWVQITLGQPYVATSDGKRIATPQAAAVGHGSPMFGSATDQYIMTYLTPVVTGLGGKATMDGDTMHVNMPPVARK